MSSGGMPSSSATICAKVVSCPCPGSAPKAEAPLCRSVDPELAAVGHAEAEDVHVLARPGADGLGEERDPDAHQFAALAFLGLLGPQLLVADHVHGQPHGGLVVAGVVHPAGLALVRELVGPQQVLQPQLRRVHLQFVGQAVDQPLDEVHRLGDPERARVRHPAGRLVGEHGGHVAVRGLDVVAAGEHPEEAGRVLGGRGDAVERAVIGEHGGADPRILPSLVAAISPTMT